MKISPWLRSSSRLQLTIVTVLLATVLTTTSIAQQGDTTQSENSETAITRFLDRVEQATAESRRGLASLYESIRNEFDLIEGVYLADRVVSVFNRYEADSTGRILWMLISILLVSGSLFVVSTGYGLIFRPKPTKSAHLEGAIDSEVTTESNKSSHAIIKIKSKAIPHAQRLPKSMIGLLKAGELKLAEELLFEEHRKNPTDSSIVMYLLACRAVDGDAASYEKLITELFPDGLDSGVQICLHAASIGRASSIENYSQNEYPEPENPFEVDSALTSKSLGPITEFGDVQTLLDLVRVYVDMGEEAQAKHLIVEILVRGNFNQRKLAILFKSRIEN